MRGKETFCEQKVLPPPYPLPSKKLCSGPDGRSPSLTGGKGLRSRTGRDLRLKAVRSLGTDDEKRTPEGVLFLCA